MLSTMMRSTPTTTRWMRGIKRLIHSNSHGGVPIVDLSLSPEQVGQDLHAACTKVGFFYLVNHGVSESGSHVLEQARAMFTTLALEQKEAMSVEHSNSYRGYQRIGVNITSGQRDGHEGWDVMSESTAAKRKQDDDDGGSGGLTNFGYNQWPDPRAVPNFRPAMEQYIDEMNGVGHRLLSAASLGLGLGEDYFQPYFTDPYWSMRLLRYPATAAPTPSSSSSPPSYDYGVGEHNDYGVFTMILCDDVPNTLQIRPRSSASWLMVNPIPGGLICNLGDMLQTWTNGQYVSTPHRVLCPPPGSQDRISVPFFFDPNYDSVIAPIDQLSLSSSKSSPDADPSSYYLFEPIMWGDHLLSKTSKNFQFPETINATRTTV